MAITQIKGTTAQFDSEFIEVPVGSQIRVPLPVAVAEGLEWAEGQKFVACRWGTSLMELVRARFTGLGQPFERKGVSLRYAYGTVEMVRKLSALGDGKKDCERWFAEGTV